MKFASSRYYPVDTQKKRVYLDTHSTKLECASVEGCFGMSGTLLNQKWKQLETEGYTVTRSSPDPRGGAGRGQGRKPNPVPIETCKLKVTEGSFTALKKQAAEVKRKSGRHVTQQDLASSLILEVDRNLVIAAVETTPSTTRQITITEAADKRLEQLVVAIAKVKPDLNAHRAMVFAAVLKVRGF
jgi:hypothetical protein